MCRLFNGGAKMKRFLLILIILFVFLCSCVNYDIHIDDTEEILYIEDTSGKKYIASKNGTTYHLESCYIVKNMNEENKRVFYDKQFFIDREMSPCKRCNP